MKKIKLNRAYKPQRGDIILYGKYVRINSYNVKAAVVIEGINYYSGGKIFYMVDIDKDFKKLYLYNKRCKFTYVTTGYRVQNSVFKNEFKILVGIKSQGSTYGSRRYQNSLDIKDHIYRLDDFE